MSTQTLSAADAALQEDYQGAIIETTNDNTYMLDRVQRDSDSVQGPNGRRAIYAVRASRNRGRGSRADGGTLPTAGVQGYADAIISIKYHFGSLEITDGAINATKAGSASFVNLLNDETERLAVDFKKDMNRQVFGDGTGLLASSATTASNTTVVTLDSVQYVAVGDPVDVVVKSDGSTSTGAVGTSVVARAGGSTKTITLAATVTVTGTAFGVYISGNRNNEMEVGLRNAVATTRSLHSINSATAGNQYWDSSVRLVGSSAAALATAGETSFEQLSDDVGSTGQGEVQVWLTSRGIRRRLADTYQSQKRFNDAQAVNVHGGYSAIMVNEMPVIIDDDCPKTYAFALNLNGFRWFQQVGGPGWLKVNDSSVFTLKNTSAGSGHSAVWQATWRWYTALGCVQPQLQGALLYCDDDNPA